MTTYLARRIKRQAMINRTAREISRDTLIVCTRLPIKPGDNTNDYKQYIFSRLPRVYRQNARLRRLVSSTINAYLGLSMINYRIWASTL